MFSSVDPRPGKRLAFYATVTASLLAAGCTLPGQTTAQTVSSEPAAQVAPAPLSAYRPVPLRSAIAELLEHADRARNLQGAELAHEIARLNEASTPADQLRLAMALSQTRQLYDLVRAQELLQRVLSNPSEEAQEVQVLARLLAARYAEQRRVEDQLDRQNQQLRELQRRLADNQEKLDALKEIERSLTSRPPAARVAPAPSPNSRARPSGS